jgi:hypothetical protein
MFGTKIRERNGPNALTSHDEGWLLRLSVVRQMQIARNVAGPLKFKELLRQVRKALDESRLVPAGYSQSHCAFKEQGFRCGADLIKEQGVPSVDRRDRYFLRNR